jgi:hypothetical protein
MSKKINYEIVEDFDDSQKNIYVKCLKSIHSIVYSNDNIDVDFLKKIIIKNKKIISCSFYWIWGDYKAKWSASFGYNREEHYTVWEEVRYQDHNGTYRSKKEPVSKTKTVTDWTPVNGADDGNFKEYCYGGSLFEKNTPFFLKHSIYQLKEINLIPKNMILLTNMLILKIKLLVVLILLLVIKFMTKSLVKICRGIAKKTGVLAII